MSTEQTTLEGFVTTELVKVPGMGEVNGTDYKSAHAASIKALDEEEAAIPEPKDKASLQAVQDFITKAERTRTGIDKFRKAMFEPLKKLQETAYAYLGTSRDNGLQADIYRIQQRAEAKKQKYLDEQTRVQREAERIMQERTEGRTAKLTGLGMSFDGKVFAYREGDQNFACTIAQVQMANDEQFAGVLAKMEALAQQRAERLAKEEEDARARAQAEEHERARLEQQAAAQEEERRRLEKERLDMEAERADLRGSELVILGAVAHGEGPTLRYEIGDVVIGHGELGKMTGGAWGEARDKVREAKVKAIEEQREWDAQMKRCADRGELLRSLGAEQYEDGGWHLGVVDGDPSVTQHDLRTMNEEEWQPVLRSFATPQNVMVTDRGPDIPPMMIEMIEPLTEDQKKGIIIPMAPPGMTVEMPGRTEEEWNEDQYRQDVKQATDIIDEVGSYRHLADILNEVDSLSANMGRFTGASSKFAMAHRARVVRMENILRADIRNVIEELLIVQV